MQRLPKFLSSGRRSWDGCKSSPGSISVNCGSTTPGTTNSKVTHQTREWQRNTVALLSVELPAADIAFKIRFTKSPSAPRQSGRLRRGDDHPGRRYVKGLPGGGCNGLTCRQRSIKPGSPHAHPFERAAGGGRQLLQQIGKAVAQLQKFAVGKIPSFAILAEPLEGKLLALPGGWLPC